MCEELMKDAWEMLAVAGISKDTFWHSLISWREYEGKVMTDRYGVKYSADGECLVNASGCTAQEYTLDSGVKYIAGRAFESSNIKKLHLPDSVVAFGMDVFGFSQIVEVNLPKSLRYIPYVNPFASCSTVKKVTSDSPLFIVKDGLLLSCDGETLYGAVTDEYPSELTLPDGLKRIANGAFHERKQLLSVYIPDSVTQMGCGCFFKSGLLQVRLSPNCKEIPEESFADCPLKEVEIPKGVEVIEDGAFNNCVNLVRVKKPRTLKSVGLDAFSGCKCKG